MAGHFEIYLAGNPEKFRRHEYPEERGGVFWVACTETSIIKSNDPGMPKTPFKQDSGFGYRVQNRVIRKQEINPDTNQSVIESVHANNEANAEFNLLESKYLLACIEAAIAFQTETADQLVS